VQDVTCGIKTLMRPDCLLRLLDSIYRFYPDMRCVIVDDSQQPTLPANYAHRDKINYITTDYDIGLGPGRNVMIDNVDTKYCVYLDDDFVFTNKTQLELMKGVLDTGKADLVGGQVRERGHFRLYHGLLDVQGSVLTYRRAAYGKELIPLNSDGQGVEIKYVDIVLNFFMARTDLLQQVKWDPELKINTHSEFFMRAKDQMKIAFCADCHVNHNRKGAQPGYGKLRKRPHRKIGLQKHGIRTCKFVGGRWG